MATINTITRVEMEVRPGTILDMYDLKGFVEAVEATEISMTGLLVTCESTENGGVMFSVEEVV
jgi:hypothetical protein